MAKKATKNGNGLVYSTDPNFRLEDEEQMMPETLLPAQQKLKVKVDTKHRAGKAVTIIEGFIGVNEDREEMGKKLKAFCGTGGSVKENLIIIQGDNCEKIIQWLHKNGYIHSKKA